MSRRNTCLLGVSWLALSALAAPAFADAAAAAEAAPAAAAEPSGTVEEMVVTAQKRAENIQDVPLSIMAVSAKAMEAKGVEDATDLERVVPNLRLDATAQQTGVAIRVRGFGAASNAAIDPSVAPYIDGAFIPRPGAVLSTFLDVQSVEVLRGPQGTLFGRNATVGALSVKTYAPDLGGFSAKVAAQAGSYGERQVEGMVNLPVNDKFAMRAAVLANSTDGFVKNKLDGKTYGQKDIVEGRLSAKWKPTDDLTWTVRADYAHQSGDGVALNQVDTSTASTAQLAAYTARLGGNPTTLSYPPSFTANQLYKNLNLSDIQYGVASDLNYQLAGGYSLRMINAYRDWNNQQSDGDVLFTPMDLLSRDATFASTSQSHELQFISPKGALLGGRLDFVSGLYYFDEDYKIGEVFNVGSQFCGFAAPAALVGVCNTFPKNGAATGNFTQNATSKAVYAQATFAITPTLDFILGGRETWDKKSGTFVQTLANPLLATTLRAPENTALSFDDSQPNWRANLSWHAAPGVMAFVTYSTGYKSGGLNSSGGTPALGQRRLFNSETSQDWEAGVKSVLFDRRLLLNATAYRTDLDNFQERSFDGTSFIVRNAGAVRAQGVELEGQAKPTSNVSIDFGVAYLDSTFTANHTAPGLPGCTGAATSCPLTQDLTGRTTTFAPKWTGNLGAEYVTDPFAGGFTLTARADASYSDRYFSINDLNPQGVVDAVTLYGARVTLASPDHSWQLALYGENLTDEHVFRTKFPQVLDQAFGVRNAATGSTLLRGFMGTPRTYGVRVSKTF
ncbi:MAG: TonB-dependent receptor [Phenylobacterium sp.]